MSKLDDILNEVENGFEQKSTSVSLVSKNKNNLELIEKELKKFGYSHRYEYVTELKTQINVDGNKVIYELNIYLDAIY